MAEVARELEAALATPRAGRVVSSSAEPGQVWFEVPLPPSAWTQDAAGTWSCPLPEGGGLLAAELGRSQLLGGGAERAPSAARTLKAGHYSIDADQIALALPPGVEPGSGLALRAPLVVGTAAGGAGRASQGDLACQGLLVFPGAPERLTCTVPARARLGFATVAPVSDALPSPSTTFRVRCDERVVFEERRTPAGVPRHAWHWVELEAGLGELVFEVEGPLPALFATPLLAPRAIGTPEQRPWPEARPDVVLVLVDTFRADSLAAWGGPAELAPRLNRFVERARRFLDARSAAAWTLPSIASVMGGVFPAQHGAVDLDRGVAPEVETLAEVFARAGYRTAAVTDAGFFSRHYGQDQGFQWFEETRVAEWKLGDTLSRARARLAADDGRPLFLVVHTYRVHGPMRVGPEEDPGPAKEALRAFHERLEARRTELKPGEKRVKALEVALEFKEQGVAFYRDAVADLDRKLGAWIEELVAAGFLERGVLVLTSDHGEALGENGELGHGGTLYDVKLRVPLALAGHGLEPGLVRGPVSLVDLAPTLAALAGVEPSATWVGRSLLRREPAGPLFAFDLMKKHRELALYQAGRKVLAPDLAALRAGAPTHAFDLARDPGEEHDLASAAPWPGELARSMAEALAPFLELSAQGPALELSPEVRAQLEAIGYGE